MSVFMYGLTIHNSPESLCNLRRGHMRLGQCGAYFWTNLTLCWQDFACESSSGLLRRNLTWFPVSGSNNLVPGPKSSNFFESGFWKFFFEQKNCSDCARNIEVWQSIDACGATRLMKLDSIGYVRGWANLVPQKIALKYGSSEDHEENQSESWSWFAVSSASGELC